MLLFVWIIILCLGLWLVIKLALPTFGRFKNRNKKPVKEIDFGYDTSIVLPDKEKLSGSFCCPKCGATTVIKEEVEPKACCKFCGAALPDLQNIIEMRNNRYHTLCNQEIEYKMQLRVIQENRETRLRELEKQKEIDQARMEYEKEQARLKFEREEQERENEHRRAVQRAESIAGLIFGVIILVAFLLRFLARK